MIHLRTIEYKPPSTPTSQFPFGVPILQSLSKLEFTSPITFLVGENGSGKSTLLEGIACAVGSITVGTQSVDTDPTLEAMRRFAKHLKLTWNKRTRRGFFMRSEDFFGYARAMATMRAELEQEAEQIKREFKGRSDYATRLAVSGVNRELYELRNYYGEGLDVQSHGESYFKLFNARFVPDGLYLLDEPEMPLSPSRQLSFLSMLKMMLEQNAQFIIATHSPILLAYPHATILSCDETPLRQVEYESLEHVNITRDFLNNREAYLKHLMNP